MWQRALASRIAIVAAKKYCDKMGVQFLDQNILLKRIAIEFSSNSLLALRRHYGFEFSTVGDRRYKGCIILLGRQVDRVDLEPLKHARAWYPLTNYMVSFLTQCFQV